MEKIRLGKTELMVSRIGFGGIPIQKPSEEEAIRLVQDSLDRGVNFIDTSRVYTTSEERIGKAIAGRRADVLLATKSVGRTPEAIHADLDQSLKNLQTDYVDLFQFHNVSTEQDLKVVLEPGGPLDAVRKARDQGRIRHIGITSHRLTVALEAVKSGVFETVMIALNFVNSEAADELIPLARENDVGIIVMKPMAGGMLDNPALSFKYLNTFPDLLVLVGIAEMGEMEQNISLLNFKGDLTDDEHREMKRIREELGNGFCRMCNYCQPCPQKIMISAIMYTEVALKRFDPKRIFEGDWDKFMDKIPECVDCGECEKRCPYELPIRERIRAAHERYNTAKKNYQESKPVNP
jgi:predicted aldo/keto reductase-like oxidoreductase